MDPSEQPVDEPALAPENTALRSAHKPAVITGFVCLIGGIFLATACASPWVAGGLILVGHLAFVVSTGGLAACFGWPPWIGVVVGLLFGIFGYLGYMAMVPDLNATITAKIKRGETESLVRCPACGQYHDRDDYRSDVFEITCEACGERFQVREPAG